MMMINEDKEEEHFSSTRKKIIRSVDFLTENRWTTKIIIEVKSKFTPQAEKLLYNFSFNKIDGDNERTIYEDDYTKQKIEIVGIQEVSFEYDIYEAPEELKGQLKLGDFFG